MLSNHNLELTNALAVLYKEGMDEHAKIHAATSAQCIDTIVELTSICLDALKNGGKIMFAGNGGSAADAQHLATELTIRFEINRPAIAAIALTTDTSALTAGANDLGFNQIFCRQIEAIGKPGDVFIGITTSGKSPNVLAAFEQAKRMNIVCAAFTGAGGITLKDQVDLLLMVPSSNTARTQEQHILLGHLLCKGLELNIQQ